MSSLLIAGCESATKSLALNVANYDALCYGNPLEIEIKEWTENGFHLNFSLSNNYYTAPIEIFSFRKNFKSYIEKGGLFEGLLIVLSSTQKFDAGKYPNFSSINGDFVQLLITVTEKTDPDDDDDDDANESNNNNTEISQNEREIRVQWALDHGFEYIEIDNRVNPTLGWKEREKEGLPRVLEALHSHTWSSLQLKDKKARSIINDVSNMRSSSNHNNDSININTSHSEFQSETETVESYVSDHNCSSSANNIDNNTTATATSIATGFSRSNNNSINFDASSISLNVITETPEHNNIPTAYIVNTQANSTSASNIAEGCKSNAYTTSSVTKEKANKTMKNDVNDLVSDEDDDTDELKLDSEFSNMIMMAKEARTKAVEGVLSDEERRQQAAQMALRMCELMGLHAGGVSGVGGDSDDSSDDED